MSRKPRRTPTKVAKVHPPAAVSPLNAIVSPKITVMRGVVLRYLEESEWPGLQSRIQLVLQIDEKTNFDAISIYRSRIKEYYLEIVFEEGSDLDRLHLRYVACAYLWRRDKVPWATIPKILNYLSLGLLLAADTERRQTREWYVYSRSPEEPPLLSPAYYRADERRLIAVFQSFGFDEAIIAKTLNAAHTAMTHNQLAWSTNNGPFKLRNVRDKIRYFERRVARRKIIIPEEETEFNSLDGQLFNLRKQGYLKRLDALLDKMGSKAWPRDRLHIHKWVEKFVRRTF